MLKVTDTVTYDLDTGMLRIFTQEGDEHVFNDPPISVLAELAHRIYQYGPSTIETAYRDMLVTVLKDKDYRVSLTSLAHTKRSVFPGRRELILRRTNQIRGTLELLEVLEDTGDCPAAAAVIKENIVGALEQLIAVDWKHAESIDGRAALARWSQLASHIVYMSPEACYAVTATAAWANILDDAKFRLEAGCPELIHAASDGDRYTFFAHSPSLD